VEAYLTQSASESCVRTAARIHPRFQKFGGGSVAGVSTAAILRGANAAQINLGMVRFCRSVCELFPLVDSQACYNPPQPYSALYVYWPSLQCCCSAEARGAWASMRAHAKCWSVPIRASSPHISESLTELRPLFRDLVRTSCQDWRSHYPPSTLPVLVSALYTPVAPYRKLSGLGGLSRDVPRFTLHTSPHTPHTSCPTFRPHTCSTMHRPAYLV
jgi:hypothetical protein